jgi:hypothetical protein
MESSDDLRYIHAKTLNKFIKYTKLLSEDSMHKLFDDIEEGQAHLVEQTKKVKYDMDQ